MQISKLENVLPKPVFFELPSVLEKYNISNEIELAHFLGQCHHESGGFKRVVENLNYSADRLLAIFPRHYNKVFAELEQRRPEMIANRVYADRMGNGSLLTGDGWKYRGRGYIQITGKHNYSLFDKQVPENILENPDLVATKYPLFSAAWFWNSRKIGTKAQHMNKTTIKIVTKMVNGGYHGFEHRKQMTLYYYDLLAGQYELENLSL